ncbi:hypothetical protein MTO96_006991 [Rhipicephalus appendiculatus]
MDEDVSDLVQRLDALNPDDVTELVLRNCFVSKPAELLKQIGRCVGLRRLSCIACPLLPSQLLQLLLERLQHLEHLELSLVEDCQSAVKRETRNVREMVWQKRDVAVTHRLRRVYVEVGGGDGNFELLWELLAFCLNLAELHVHFVRGNFSNALLECRRLHDDLDELETFAFTSEVQVPFPYEPDSSSAFRNFTTVCANVRHKRSGDSWSCVELDNLAYSPHRVLPSPVVMAAVITDSTGESFRIASRGKCWASVREFCLLLLPLVPSVKFYPTVSVAYHKNLRWFFSVALKHVVELNLTSFHFQPDLDTIELLPEETLKRLHALSAPPCAFPRQSNVRSLLTLCSNLRELDVRIDRRGGQFQCASCKRLVNIESVEPPRDSAPSAVRSGVIRLTVCDVPAHVQPWFLECCPVAVRVRLVESPVSTSRPEYDYLGVALAGNSAIRCLVLGVNFFEVKDRQLLEILSRIATLEHLCLLTSRRVPDVDASRFAVDITDCMRRLKFLHMHYVYGAEKRVTWVRGPPDGVLVQERPCFACCSTSTFIGLVKPVNRDCEEDL